MQGLFAKSDLSVWRDAFESERKFSSNPDFRDY